MGRQCQESLGGFGDLRGKWSCPAMIRYSPVSCRQASSFLAPLDPRTQLPQSFIDALIAARDLFDVVNDRRALGAERGDQQRHN